MEDVEPGITIYDLTWVLGFKRITPVVVLRLDYKRARTEAGRPVRRGSWQEMMAT